MRPPAAIVDTNVVVSGLLTPEPKAPTALILEGMLSGRFPFLLSIDLLAEYRSVLLRPGIRKRHRLSEADVDAVLTEIAASGQVRDVAEGPLNRADGDEHLRALLECEPGGDLVTCDEALRRGFPAGRTLSPREFVKRLTD